MTATKIKLIKEAPPAVKIGRKRHDVIPPWLEAIRDEGSGEWFKYPTRIHSSIPTNIKKGKVGDFEAGEFQAVIRQVQKNKGWLYARYVGSAPK